MVAITGGRMNLRQVNVYNLVCIGRGNSDLLLEILSFLGKIGTK